MISPMQRPVRDNTQHSQATNIHANNSSGRRPTHALDRAVAGIAQSLCIAEYVGMGCKAYE